MPQQLKRKARPAIYPTQAFIEFLRKESKSMAEEEGCRSRVPFWRVLNHLKEEVETWRARAAALGEVDGVLDGVVVKRPPPRAFAAVQAKSGRVPQNARN